MDKLTARVELIEARTAISDLIYNYARNIRNGDLEKCIGMYTEDAVFEVRGKTFGSSEVPHPLMLMEGRSAIADYIFTSLTGPPILPVVLNLVIEVNGHHAKCHSVMKSIEPSTENIFGDYEDHCRYENGWHFSKRVFTRYSEQPYLE